jgi:hypothetical protein
VLSGRNRPFRMAFLGLIGNERQHIGLYKCDDNVNLA